MIKDEMARHPYTLFNKAHYVIWNIPLYLKFCSILIIIMCEYNKSIGMYYIIFMKYIH